MPLMRSASSARSRRPGVVRRMFRSLLLLMLIGVAILSAGFFVFANSLPRSEMPLEQSADGIVVLTGGASRIVDAIELLAAHHGERLLISGVHPSTTPDELIRVNPEFERLIECCIDLGHDAQNTVGNAVETARWTREHRFGSLVVVTSSWHMPRALVELEYELPGVNLIPYPVVSERMREEPWWSDPQTTRVLLLEYVKYVAACLRVHVDPLGATGAHTRVGPSPS